MDKKLLSLHNPERKVSGRVMRGRRISLSPPRRIITDLMRIAATVPSVPVERLMDLSALIATRTNLRERPPWVGIFAKAYALTAQEFPELRRTFVKWPWSYLYEYQASVAAVTIERQHEGQSFVILRIIRSPESLPIGIIAKTIEEAINTPMDKLPEFRRTLNTARLPSVIRRPLLWLAFNAPRHRANHFGTFTVTAVSFLGADALHLPTWTTSLLTFGVFRPDGKVPVRITMDHRVFDGMAIAKIMARLETILTGPILQELQADSVGLPAVASA
jgi:hypothetical protein